MLSCVLFNGELISDGFSLVDEFIVEDLGSEWPEKVGIFKTNIQN